MPLGSRPLGMLVVTATAIAVAGCSYRRAPVGDAGPSQDGRDANTADRTVPGDGVGEPLDGNATDVPTGGGEGGAQSLADGVPCATDPQCTSAHCVDGVCCESACTGQCQACAEPNFAGKCVMVAGAPRGTTRAACAGQGPCAARCDGSDASQCHNPGSEVQCSPPSCASGSARSASVCDRAGACTVVTAVPCASNMCADTTQCSGGCGATQPCAGGQYCEPTTKACLSQKTNGQGCTSDAECASNACTDHVCCASRCSGQCQSCAEAGMLGQCVTVSGTPRGTTRAACAGQGACASRCDGVDTTQCQYPGSGVQCTGSTCAAGIARAASVCNGAGACTAATAMMCASNQCADSTKCSGGCSAAQPCAATQYCDPTTKACVPLKANGAACASDPECTSKACTDGVCCNLRCGGQCEACAEPNNVGTCIASQGAPRGNTRPPCAGTRDACRGMCDGVARTQCSFPSASVQCLPASCVNGTLTTASVCNGGGDCTAPTTAACHSTQCSSTTRCLDNCSAAAPCSGGFYCDAAGVCRAQIGSGACQTDAQCFSGHCAQGVCCNQTCSGTCSACNLPGSTGTCTNRITEFSALLGGSFESAPITVGADNNLWVVEEGAGSPPESYLGRITTAGAITEFKIITIERGSLVSGPDGNLWFSDTTDDPSFTIFRAATSGMQLPSFVPPGGLGLGRMFADGGGVWAVQADSVAGIYQLVQLNAGLAVVRRVTVPVVAGDMAHGSDGNLWFVSSGAVFRVAANNGVTSFPVPGVTSQSGIAASSDGFIWFSEPQANKIGKMSVTGNGAFTETAIPTVASAPGKMLFGPGGTVWVAETTPPKLGRVQSDGTLTECPLGGAGFPEIAAGPDGNVWIAKVGTPTRIDRFIP